LEDGLPKTSGPDESAFDLGAQVRHRGEGRFKVFDYAPLTLDRAPWKLHRCEAFSPEVRHRGSPARDLSERARAEPGPKDEECILRNHVGHRAKADKRSLEAAVWNLAAVNSWPSH
jgi:hypothetical protein